MPTQTSRKTDADIYRLNSAEGKVIRGETGSWGTMDKVPTA
ncbi:MAG: hypothetical protein AAGB18_08235 [Pseudomonadota bacterium]